MKRTMVLGVLVVMGLLGAVALAANEAKIAESKETDLAQGTTIKSEIKKKSVRIDNAQWSPEDAAYRYRAMIFPQQKKLTGDTNDAKAKFTKTGASGDAAHIELERGMVYIHAYVMGALSAAGEAKLLTNPYPISTVKAVEAGAEGTDLLVAVVALPGNDDDVLVVVLHMGSEDDGRIWVKEPSLGEQQVQNEEKDEMFVAVRVNSYTTTSPTYAWMKVLDFDGKWSTGPDEGRACLAAKKIHKKITKRLKADPEGFWNPGTPDD